MEPVDWIKLQQLVEEKKVKITTLVEAVHQKKLIALGIKENFNINNKNINMRRNNIDKSEKIINTETIFNFSKRVLNPTETSVLNKGLKFGIKNSIYFFPSSQPFFNLHHQVKCLNNNNKSKRNKRKNNGMIK